MNLFSAAVVISLGVMLAWVFGPSRYEIVTVGTYGEHSMLLDRSDGRVWRRQFIALPGNHGDNPVWFEMPRLDAPKDFHAASRERWLTGYRNQVHWRFEEVKRRRETLSAHREEIEKQIRASEEMDVQAEISRRDELAKQAPPNPVNRVPLPDGFTPMEKLTPEEHARTFPSERTQRLRLTLDENTRQMNAADIDANRF